MGRQKAAGRSPETRGTPTARVATPSLVSNDADSTVDAIALEVSGGSDGSSGGKDGEAKFRLLTADLESLAERRLSSAQEAASVGRSLNPLSANAGGVDPAAAVEGAVAKAKGKDSDPSARLGQTDGGPFGRRGADAASGDGEGVSGDDQRIARIKTAGATPRDNAEEDAGPTVKGYPPWSVNEVNALPPTPTRSNNSLDVHARSASLNLHASPSQRRSRGFSGVDDGGEAGGDGEGESLWRGSGDSRNSRRSRRSNTTDADRRARIERAFSSTGSLRPVSPSPGLSRGSRATSESSSGAPAHHGAMALDSAQETHVAAHFARVQKGGEENVHEPREDIATSSRSTPSSDGDAYKEASDISDAEEDASAGRKDADDGAAEDDKDDVVDPVNPSKVDLTKLSPSQRFAVMQVLRGMGVIPPAHEADDDDNCSEEMTVANPGGRGGLAKAKARAAAAANARAAAANAAANLGLSPGMIFSHLNTREMTPEEKFIMMMEERTGSGASAVGDGRRTTELDYTGLDESASQVGVTEQENVLRSAREEEGKGRNGGKVVGSMMAGWSADDDVDSAVSGWGGETAVPSLLAGWRRRDGRNPSGGYHGGYHAGGERFRRPFHPAHLAAPPAPSQPQPSSPRSRRPDYPMHLRSDSLRAAPLPVPEENEEKEEEDEQATVSPTAHSTIRGLWDAIRSTLSINVNGNGGGTPVSHQPANGAGRSDRTVRYASDTSMYYGDRAGARVTGYGDASEGPLTPKSLAAKLAAHHSAPESEVSTRTNDDGVSSGGGSYRSGAGYARFGKGGAASSRSVSPANSRRGSEDGSSDAGSSDRGWRGGNHSERGSVRSWTPKFMGNGRVDGSQGGISRGGVRPFNAYKPSIAWDAVNPSFRGVLPNEHAQEPAHDTLLQQYASKGRAAERDAHHVYYNDLYNKSSVVSADMVDSDSEDDMSSDSNSTGWDPRNMTDNRSRTHEVKS